MDAPTLSKVLMISLILLAHFQPNASRTCAAACFAGVSAAHGLLFWSLDGFSYYFSAALFNLATVALLNCVRPICRTTIQLQRIAFAMILANGLGALLWYYYFEPTFYNWAFAALYGWGCATIFPTGPRDKNGFAINRWRGCFRFSRLASVDFMRKIKPEIR